MIYLLISLLISSLAIVQVLTGKQMVGLYKVLLIILFILNAFRFGIGTDYFNYMYLYNNVPSINSPMFLSTEIHGEIGFRISIGIFKMFNLSYYSYVFFISSIIFYIIYLKLDKYSKYPLFSLLILYSMYYFTYFNSGFRQGLTLVIFLLILIPLLLEERYFKFVLYTLICSLFHMTILTCLLLIIIKFNWKSKEMLLIMSLSITFCLVSIITHKNIILYFFEKIGLSVTYSDIEFNLFGLISRLVVLFIIMSLVYFNKNQLSINQNKLLTYYLVGFSIYLIFVNQSLVASRVHAYFKIIEVILIPSLLYSLDISKKIVYSILIIGLILPVFYVKEINAQIGQSNYFNDRNITEYNYVSIWNKKKMYESRFIPGHIQIYLE